MFKFQDLQRDDSYISSLVDKNMIPKEDLYIVFPSRFLKVDLASIGRYVITLGVFIITDGKKYKLVNFPAKLTLSPYSIQDIVYEDKSYQVLSFRKGQPIFNTNKYIPSKDDIEILFDDFVIKNNNIPFYIGYIDLLEIFLKGSQITGNSKGSRISEFSALLAIIARDSNNDYIRYHKLKDIKNMKIKYVGYSNVASAYKNTFSNLSGAYMDKGITSSLANDNPVKTDIEDVFNK
jgi:hypothetical protein